ncbi:MAG TPA: hypothetical protein VG722_05520 [Tepidisphaeraceae bacterium]|nr:hypothetical protein [Tepidisphaeraceae bacterium]
MSQITLHLSGKVAADLAAASREAKKTPEAFAEELVSRALSARKLREAHAKLARYGKAAGFETDEDVYKAIS